MKDTRIAVGQPCFILYYNPIRMNKAGEPDKEIKERVIQKVGRQYIYTDTGDRFNIKTLRGHTDDYKLFFSLEAIDEFFEKIRLFKIIKNFNWYGIENSIEIEDYKAICAILEKYRRE